jgi:hypothetical protein
VAVLVSVHGPRDKPVRNPVIQEVCWPGADLTEPAVKAMA